MGNKIKNFTLIPTFFLAGIIGLHSQLLGAELIELNRVVAKVNDRIVTWGEIEKDMTLLNFTEKEKQERANEFVDSKIDRLLSIISFRDKGMSIPEAYIEQEYNKRLIQDFNGDRKLFRDTLMSKGLSQLEYRKELEEKIIYSHMLSTRRKLNEEISPIKVESFYRDNLNLFKTEEKIQIAEIAFSQIAKEPKAVLLQQAQKVFAQIKAGMSFEEAASKNGQSRYREKSGDWGYMVTSKEILNEEFKKHAFALRKGDMSEPFVVNIMSKKADGSVYDSEKITVYILKVIERTEAGRLPLDQVRSQIERTIASKIEAQSHRQWLSRLKRDAYVRVSLPN